jgi:hypothetical protein
MSSGLYDEGAISCFGIQSPHWRNESDRKRELSMRHDYVCALLCNLELNPLQMTLDAISHRFKRKREKSSTGSESPAEKRQRLTSTPIPDPEMEVSMPSQLESAMSTSTETGSSSVPDDANDEIDSEEKYRFWLLEGMPNADNIQFVAAQEWGISPPDSMWDIVDRKYKKFIEVKVSMNWDNSVSSYNEKSLHLGEHSSLFWVHPNTLQFRWLDHPGDANGIEKVLKFLTNRKQVMAELGIQDSVISETGDMQESVLCSKSLNEMVDIWVKTWWEPAINPVDLEPLYSKGAPELKQILPGDLLKHLVDPSIRDTEFIKWKGKLSPECFVHNLTTTNSTDYEMICDFNKFITSEPIIETHRIGYKSSNTQFPIEAAKEIIDFVGSIQASTYNIISPTSENTTKIQEYLGVNYKSTFHNDNDSETLQPTYAERVPRKYHWWVDLVMAGMNKNSETADVGTPLSQLYDRPIEVNHTIAAVCEESTDNILQSILPSNSAVMCSKISNIYSRLGGSYSVRRSTDPDNCSHKGIAAFPIYATLHSKKSNEVTGRVVSGVVVRGPQHTKSQTDKINLLTIEILKRTDESHTFCRYYEKAIIAVTKNNFIVVRQNSIKKIEPTYVMFIHNSLFVPCNLIGELTINNPEIASNCNIRQLINEFVTQNEMWIRERFTEGVMSALIGNSADEGYFAGLRKIFMIILCWKRGKACASFDVVGLCSSINECLLDNPLSMHFHQTLLKILKSFNRRLNEGSISFSI